MRVDLTLWIFIAWILIGGIQEADLQVRMVGAAILFASVLLHEFGHCAAARWVGGSADEIVLGPLGGLAMVNTAQRPWPVFVSTAGGPAVNVLLCVLASGVIWLRWGVVTPLGPFDGYMPDSLYEDNVAFSLWWISSINRLLLYFNVLPILPMDGGRILQSILWRWFGNARAWYLAGWVGIIGAVIVTIWVAARMGGLDPLFGYLMLSNVFFCAGQIRRKPAPEGDVTSAWSGDVESETAAADTGGWLARWRKRRAERAKRRGEREIDAILAKVSADGMDSLSRRELAILKEATERRQAASRRVVGSRE